MKITFIGAGSTGFVRNIIGDCMLIPELGEFDVCLFDIDAKRLEESYEILCNMKETINGKANLIKTLDKIEAFTGADFIINAIQVGGYEPCTVTDFEIPKKYGIRQTIGDTLGIGGIFRALRTIPVMKDYADVIEKHSPRALFINYSNPMAMLTGYMQRYTKVNTIGLCHSVQTCVMNLLHNLNLTKYNGATRSLIAGINHQAWLLKIEDMDGNDLYPEIKRVAELSNGGYVWPDDFVRFEMMKRFGYYITESSEHSSEYFPYFIKKDQPELLEKYHIPLDEYPRRCVKQIKEWNEMKHSLLKDSKIGHDMSIEYAAFIIKSMITDQTIRINANVQNTGLIPNLPSNACVEVPCLVDRNGVVPCVVGDLPEQLAALNRTNINPQLMTILAAATLKKEYIYMAAMLDPHTSAELSIDNIVSLCDDMIETHKGWLPEYK